MRARIVTVTPGKAAEWMKKNVRNRAVSQRTIEAYAEDMSRGDWQLTGEAIKFDVDGNLSDGQHRLSACILSGVAFQSLVVEGVKRSAFNHLDQGRKRSVADAFSRDRKKHYVALAAAARVVQNLSVGGLAKSGPRFTIDAAMEVLRRYPHLERIVDQAITLHHQSVGCPFTYSEIAGYWAYTSVKHGAKADAFWEQVITGLGLTKGCPAKLLRDSVAKVLVGGGGLSNSARHAYFVKAFNGHITGKVPKILKFSPTDSQVEFV